VNSLHSVAITGLGLVCALGASLREAWPRLLAGEHGIAPITRFDAAAYPARLAAEVAGVDADAADPERMAPLRRGTRLFVAAACEAWRDAGLREHEGPEPARIAAGASVNYLHMGHLQALWACRDPSSALVDLGRARQLIPSSSFPRRQGETISAAAARALRADGPRVTIDTACAAGAHAIVDAFRAVARGEVVTAVAGGGAGLIMPVTVLAFARLGALTRNTDPQTASRPFDRHRDGFVLGEGAAAVVLERAEHAYARGARAYAEVLGAASTINGASLTDPSRGGEVEAATIRLALRDAGLTAGEVDYIAAHGTSTPKNDAIETLAIKQALGEHAAAVAVSSHKGQLGHTLPAAGAINVVLGAMALASQTIPPTAHLDVRDPDCDLDYVPGVGRRAPLRVALAHAFAFGGQNVVIALRRPALAAREEDAADDSTAPEAA
jgi:3-oxoacyl-[acyl-carrier-protein] synthase II